jgi:hypothetical protein
MAVSGLAERACEIHCYHHCCTDRRTIAVRSRTSSLKNLAKCDAGPMGITQELLSETETVRQISRVDIINSSA